LMRRLCRGTVVASSRSLRRCPRTPTFGWRATFRDARRLRLRFPCCKRPTSASHVPHPHAFSGFAAPSPQLPTKRLVRSSRVTFARPRRERGSIDAAWPSCFRPLRFSPHPRLRDDSRAVRHDRPLLPAAPPLSREPLFPRSPASRPSRRLADGTNAVSPWRADRVLGE